LTDDTRECARLSRFRAALEQFAEFLILRLHATSFRVRLHVRCAGHSHQRRRIPSRRRAANCKAPSPGAVQTQALRHELRANSAIVAPCNSAALALSVGMPQIACRLHQIGARLAFERLIAQSQCFFWSLPGCKSTDRAEVVSPFPARSRAIFLFFSIRLRKGIGCLPLPGGSLQLGHAVKLNFFPASTPPIPETQMLGARDSKSPGRELRQAAWSGLCR